MSDAPFETPCRKAGPDREPEGLRLWTTDSCANVVFNAVKRPLEHFEEGEPIPRRRWQFRSVRPIRAAGHRLTGEVCRYHYGRLVKRPGNRWRVAFCTEPGAGQEEKRYGIASFFIEPKARAIESELEDTRIKPGRAGAGGAYVTPWWSELHVHSVQRICGAEQT